MFLLLTSRDETHQDPPSSFAGTRTSPLHASICLTLPRFFVGTTTLKVPSHFIYVCYSPFAKEIDHVSSLPSTSNDSITQHALMSEVAIRTQSYRIEQTRRQDYSLQYLLPHPIIKAMQSTVHIPISNFLEKRAGFKIHNWRAREMYVAYRLIRLLGHFSAKSVTTQ